ncbi:MAG: C-GCAxxG-C-C family protein [Desulfobacterota bacterium]|nr:C-GCAxxG-C-C family protein [Thermodesulfobacteriota bacterium]
MIQKNRHPVSSPAQPWPYPEFDVEQVRRRGYEFNYEKACMYGVIKAIAASAAVQYPYPWNTLPLDAFYYGRGGAYSWGTLCGTLNGGLFVLTLVLGDCPDAADDLMTWYIKTPLPTLYHDAYCRFRNQPRSVAGSPLCHQSIGSWIKVSGKGIHTPECFERCAKLTGDTAAYVASILNRIKKGDYKPANPLPEEVHDCLGCHFGQRAVKDDTITKMQCLDCHEVHR